MVATLGQGPERSQEVAYTDIKVIGNGSFGVVYQARLAESRELVAIKKVLQDKRFKVAWVGVGWGGGRGVGYWERLLSVPSNRARNFMISVLSITVCVCLTSVCKCVRHVCTVVCMWRPGQLLEAGFLPLWNSGTELRT